MHGQQEQASPPTPEPRFSCSASTPAAVKPPLKVMLVDAHYFTRLGVRTALAGQAGLEVVAEASSAEEAASHLQQVRPDLIILDPLLPDRDGFDLVRETSSRLPELRWLIFSTEDNEEVIYRARTASVHGYLAKSADWVAFMQAIHAITGGQHYFPSEVRLRLRRRHGQAALSKRERQILDGLAQGLSNKQLADSMGLRVSSIKTFVARLMAKMGVHNRTQAVITGIERGLVRLPSH
jgi:DNA-binding NarL/FixJ family response regulator